ncbi:Retrovirus-related Pol polyprotein from transposon TNT 1-94 [Dendrobium catenatum]|uniref:Retrovirus-related Pol polyprotein from transposon TNT 1-94 n=1 Tax=Dendrobium catenatum TaxID=906689 RepID=A0A2I0VKD1_9ASPA|nr:Retrovirus-related Pol polyprotein from transposon TNT 1-94 [Dendrobium catenatum]
MKGYKCQNLATHKVIYSRHVQFNESSFPFPNRTSAALSPTMPLPPSLLTPASVQQHNISSGSMRHSTPTVQNNVNVSQPTATSSTTPAITIPTSASVDLNIQAVLHHKHPMTTRRQTGSLKPVQKLNLLHKEQSSLDPTSYSEASKKFEWRRAMAEEFIALQKQGTWELVAPPSTCSILGSKWTYRTKYNSDGSVARFKARLVALGNQQEHGLDYSDTFSPVAKLPTIRILFTIALFYSWKILQLDVTNAFLHGDINEVVYMKQPKGFEDSTNPNHVCRLRKAIYGLRQAPRQWYTTFTSYLQQLGFSHSQADPSLLFLHRNTIQIYLLVYVDDILLTGNDPSAIQQLVQQLQLKFTMKNLGSPTHFLGIKIDTTADKYFLSQAFYEKSIVELAELQNCNSVANPCVTKLAGNLSTSAPSFSPAVYRQLIGSLQYLTLTRPDIAYAVNALSQHMHDPASAHTSLLKKLIRYIKGTTEFGLPITKSTLLLKTYSDVDWASDPVTRKSTSGFCTFFGRHTCFLDC